MGGGGRGGGGGRVRCHQPLTAVLSGVLRTRILYAHSYLGNEMQSPSTDVHTCAPKPCTSACSRLGLTVRDLSSNWKHLVPHVFPLRHPGSPASLPRIEAQAQAQSKPTTDSQAPPPQPSTITIATHHAWLTDEMTSRSMSRDQCLFCSPFTSPLSPFFLPSSFPLTPWLLPQARCHLGSGPTFDDALRLAACCMPHASYMGTRGIIIGAG